ncbi:hypothetical protein EV1_033491 [Malus domestica]
MADVEADVVAVRIPKKRTFKKFSFRGVNLDALLDMSTDELVKLFPTIGLAEGSRKILLARLKEIFPRITQETSL